DVHAPPCRSPLRDLLDDAKRLVAGDHRQPAAAHGALVLLDVAAADTARLDSQQRAVLGADNRAGELAYLHLPGAGLDHGADPVSHVVLYSPFRGPRGYGGRPAPPMRGGSGGSPPRASTVRDTFLALADLSGWARQQGGTEGFQRRS